MNGIVRTVVVIAVLIASMARANDARADEITTVYYRDPDATISNLSEIRKAFNAAAREQGVNIEVRPISQHRRFVSAIGGVQNGFVLMPSWIRFSRKVNLQTLLVGQRSGKTTFTHVVLQKENAPQTSGQIQIAGVVDSEYWDRVTAGNAPSQLKAGRFIEVPKHLDGIMALSYGQVRYAILPNVAVQTIRKEVPALLKGIVVLYETEPQTNLSLFSIGAQDATQKQKVTRFCANLAQKKRGRVLLKLLGYDTLIVPPAPPAPPAPQASDSEAPK
jgi:hypothetical protein